MTMRWDSLMRDNVLNGTMWDDMGFLLTLIWEVFLGSNRMSNQHRTNTFESTVLLGISADVEYMLVGTGPGIKILCYLPSRIKPFVDLSWGLRRQMTTISYLCQVTFLGGLIIFSGLLLFVAGNFGVTFFRWYSWVMFWVSSQILSGLLLWCWLATFGVIFKVILGDFTSLSGLLLWCWLAWHSACAPPPADLCTNSKSKKRKMRQPLRKEKVRWNMMLR